MAASESAPKLDREVVAFIHGGVAAAAATRVDDLKPEFAGGAFKKSADGSVSVCWVAGNNSIL
jgi:hypothetical protein